MRIGYPCINRSLACRGTRTFRLRSYSPERFRQTLAGNLDCLRQILEWNEARGIRLFRISSDLVPFASHPVCSVPWQREFRAEFEYIGRFVRRQRLRVSMHPDQFVLVNARDERVFESSRRELEYHARVLDLLGMPASARIQIHLGGVYGDKTASLARFVERWHELPAAVRRRLAVENDDRLYTVADCLTVSRLTGIPVVFDAFHHRLNPDGTGLAAALRRCAATWRRGDGPPLVDYSSQQPGARRGAHAGRLDALDFRRFLRATAGLDFDLMLEIKDKERSALAALQIAGRGLERHGKPAIIGRGQRG